MSCNSDRVGQARSNADGKGAPSWKRAGCHERVLCCLFGFSHLPGLCPCWSFGTLLRVGVGVVMAKGSLSSLGTVGYTG